MKADLILHSANVLTLDPARPHAQAVAIQGDKIIAVGSNDEVAGLRGPDTETIHCQGKTLVPGFNDAHCHILGLASSLLAVDCYPWSVGSIEDIVAAIRRRTQTTPRGDWIRAEGYHDFLLAERRHPTRHDLDRAAPDHPVRLIHQSGHACVLNSPAMTAVGLSFETEEPPGGIIDRDLEGEPTGLLFEMNHWVAQRAGPSFSDEEMDPGVRLASERLLSLGITSVQDATAHNGPIEWQTMRRLKASRRFLPRVSLMVGFEALDEIKEAGLGPGSGDDELRLGPVKLLLSQVTGRLHPPEEELLRRLLGAQEAGFAVAIHAIEEGEVAAAVAALEAARERLSGITQRHRIEHCSQCPPHLLGRLARTGATVVSQPPFLYYNGDRYLAQVPTEQQPWLYRFRSFIEAGIPFAASSDFPAVPPSPLLGIHAATSRRTLCGQSLLPQQALSPQQALRAYTKAAAWAAGEEMRKGTLAPGKLADLALLSADPTQVPAEAIPKIEVEMTLLGGRVVWRRSQA